MDCIYEEPLSVSSTNPRWYQVRPRGRRLHDAVRVLTVGAVLQISHKEQPVFYITQTAVPYPTIAAGPQSLRRRMLCQIDNTACC